MGSRVLALGALTSETPSGSERGHAHAKRDHRLTMALKVGWIALAVDIYVWSVGIGGIGPEVVGLREEVMQSTRIPVRRKGRDRLRRQVKILPCGLENASPIHRRDEGIAGRRLGVCEHAWRGCLRKSCREAGAEEAPIDMASL